MSSPNPPPSAESFRDRLSMIGEGGRRDKIYPAEVQGAWRKRRDQTQALLIFVFLLLPWTRVNGEQTLWLDLSQRRFAIFGLVFQAHDGPLLFFVLGTAAVGLAYLTAMWGRVWCGWACPQTVFLDGVYRRIERAFEGSHLQRRALDRQDMTFKKAMIKTGKWLTFAAVSLAITHSFLAYFVGAENLLRMVSSDPAQNPASFLFILASSGIVLFDFGWFREQFCIVACPYGRFQAVLMDTQSLTVTYDTSRGEPRKGVLAKNERQGDCVSCGRCVAVCPTGIDIRNGAQMECIGCTACIDACDEIMTKVKKPTGLIRYDSINPRSRWYLRPRAMGYAAVLCAMITGLTIAIATRKDFSAQLLRGLDTPFTSIAGPEGENLILNHLRLHLHSQIGKPQNLKIEIDPPDFSLKMAEPSISLAPQAHREVHLFVTGPVSKFRGTGKTLIEVRIQNDRGTVTRVKGSLLGPY